MTSRHLPRIATIATLFCTAQPVLAITGVWDTTLGAGNGTGASAATPWITTTGPGSLYAEWNFFNDEQPATFTVEDSTPDIATAGIATGAALLRETTGGAFLTSGGNIYSPSIATAFNVTLPGATGTFDVWLRTATIGSLLDTTATLNGVAATAQESFATTIPGGFGGDEKEWYWTWTVTDPAQIDIAFVSAASSVSLDQVAVHAAPVPEPGTWAMLALGLLGVGVATRGRQAH